MKVAAGGAPEASAKRTPIYLALNAVFCVVVVALSLAGPADNPRAAYLCLLMAICSSPLLWMQRYNDRFVLLSIFLATFFVFYGASDISTLTGAAPFTSAQGILSAPECAILMGAALAILGYHAALAVSRRREPPAAARDWPAPLIVVGGIALWAVGTFAVWVWQVKFQINGATLSKEFSNSTLLMLAIGRMLQPLGTIMMAYALLQTRSRPLLLVVLVTIAVQVVVGFIGDSKETAMRSVIILIMAGVLLEGKLPKAWFAVAIAFVTLAFPVFQGFRAEVIGMHGMSRSDAAADLGRSLDLALKGKGKVQRGHSEDYRAPTFLQRSALKPTMELLIEKTGTVAPFQDGYTLSLFFTGFVPRFIWPDKPDSSVGQLMNRQFHMSEDPNTYISATHLGEFYWNFGWPGIVAGMLAFGFMLGFINSKCDLSERRSLTRLLVLVTVIYATIVRFEGSIALEYIVLVRSLALIWLMHALFARIRVDDRRTTTPGPRSPSAPAIYAPQLLR
jgi:hypothetical protein